ncbi:hypothetical protein ACFV9C_34070, partial [Kribbella sp. NPDC059898]
MPADGGLTAAEAAARSAVVSVTSYAITLDLTPLTTGDHFTSRTTVDFSYDGTGGPGLTWIDLVADQVDQVALDGVPLDPSEALRGPRLRLAPLGGPHRLDIHSRHRAGPGRGLSKTVDPAPAPVPGSGVGSASASAPGSAPGSASASAPGSAPAPRSGVGSDSGAGPSTSVRAAVGGADAAGGGGGGGRGGGGGCVVYTSDGGGG